MEGVDYYLGQQSILLGSSSGGKMGLKDVGRIANALGFEGMAPFSDPQSRVPRPALTTTLQTPRVNKYKPTSFSLPEGIIPAQATVKGPGDRKVKKKGRVVQDLDINVQDSIKLANSIYFSPDQIKERFESMLSVSRRAVIASTISSGGSSRKKRSEVLGNVYIDANDFDVLSKEDSATAVADMVPYYTFPVVGVGLSSAATTKSSKQQHVSKFVRESLIEHLSKFTNITVDVSNFAASTLGSKSQVNTVNMRFFAATIAWLSERVDGDFESLINEDSWDEIIDKETFVSSSKPFVLKALDLNEEADARRVPVAKDFIVIFAYQAMINNLLTGKISIEDDEDTDYE